MEEALQGWENSHNLPVNMSEDKSEHMSEVNELGSNGDSQANGYFRDGAVGDQGGNVLGEVKIIGKSHLNSDITGVYNEMGGEVNNDDVNNKNDRNVAKSTRK